MGKWLGKTPDASDSDRRKLASETRDVAGEIEVNAIDLPDAQKAEANTRAEALRRDADRIDPDK